MNQISERYKDQSADLALKSSDGVTFQVHSYFLKAHSTVFRDMLDLPTLSHSSAGTAGTTTSKAIEIDASASALQDFLDLMTQDILTTLLSPAPYTTIFGLIDQFACPTIGERARRILQDTVVFVLWEPFCLAVRHKDRSLARAALEAVGIEGGNEEAQVQVEVDRTWFDGLTLHTFPAERAKEISVEYLLALLKALGTVPAKKSGYRIGTRDWESLAKAFQP